MKRTILTMLILFFWVVPKAQLPDIEVKDIDQNWISLNDLKGEKLTVVDFWATWCKPCITSIPKLNKLHEEFADKGVEFIGVNVDAPRSIAKVKPFVNSIGIQYPVVLDPDQELVDRFNVEAFPTLIILDKKGKEIFIHEGFNAGDEKLFSEELVKILDDAK